MNEFYKRNALANSPKEIHDNVFPLNEQQINLHQLIRDTTIVYSDFANWLFQKHWVTVEKENAKLYISPIFDFAMGDDLKSTSAEKSKLFRNTRGIYVTGSIGNKLSFQFSFAENQARFMNYENQYFKHAGEFYDQAIGYYKRNAVIPGGSRTKDFKVDAFDYAYSIGMVNFQATKNLRFEFGNQANFVGIGYRSLFLSDHSINALGLRTSYKISDKFSVQWLLKNHRNLYRKPRTNFVESPYENKFYSATYLTYKPVKNLAISWFSAANTLRGDSIQKHGIQWQSVVPVPIINTDLAFTNSVMNGISGFNLEWSLNKWRFYGQIAVDKWNNEFLLASQLGAHYFNAFGIKNWNFQLEGNYVPNRFYTNENSKLSYSNGQLALAHPKGHNFTELVFKTNYEWKRLFVDLTQVFYVTNKTSNRGEVGTTSVITQQTATTLFTTDYLRYTTNFTKLQLGYRFNRKYNGMVYVDFIYRTVDDGQNKMMQPSILAGIKTSLFNQCFDF